MLPNIQRDDRSRASPDREELRLVCFPQAGNDGSLFAGWAKALPPGMALYRVVLPGRGRQFDEAPLTNFAAAKDLLDRQVRTLADRPLILLGHSLGALLAFETARTLASYLDALRCLVVSGCPAPREHRPSELSDLPNDALLHRLHEGGGLPAPAGVVAEMLELALPVIRADLAVYDSYVSAPSRHPLDCPLLALSGREDREAPVASMAGWRLETSKAFRHEVFAGDHGFIESLAEPAIDLTLALAGVKESVGPGRTQYDL